jgi:4-hydroxy-tetrahydrodipicolinate reductase
MNIALIGYGQMGKCIEKFSIKRGHKVKLKTNTTPRKDDLLGIDVAIEFTNPQVTYKNLLICLENNIPTVCGTTGWIDQYDKIKEICLKHKGTFLFSSNFSIGVHIFFEINRYLSKLLGHYSNISIEEFHHTKKKDSPSGTTITIAENVGKPGILITSKRFNNLSGIHIVKYQSYIDEIILKHSSHNRNGFALGAIIASEWIIGKKGIFSLKDVFKNINLFVGNTGFEPVTPCL